MNKSGPKILQEMNTIGRLLRLGLLLSLLFCLLFFKSKTIIYLTVLFFGILSLLVHRKEFQYLKKNHAVFIFSSSKEIKNERLKAIFIGLPIVVFLFWYQTVEPKSSSNYLIMASLTVLNMSFPFILVPKRKLTLLDNFLIYPGWFKTKGVYINSNFSIYFITPDKHELVYLNQRIELLINVEQANQLKLNISKLTTHQS